MEDFDFLNLKDANGLPALGPMVASNPATSASFPGPSFQQMPAPLERGAPPPAAAAGPARVAPKPEADDSENESEDVAKPDGEGKPNPLADLLLSKDDLKNSNKKKALYNGLASLADGLSNQQSWGNFYLHQLNPHVDAGAPFKALSDQAGQQVSQKQMLLKQALNEPDFAMKLEAGNPSSGVSKIASAAAQAYAQKNGMSPEDFKGKSLLEINAVAPGVMEALGKENAMMQHYKMMADLATRRLDQGDQRIAMGKDNQTKSANDIFDKDTLSNTLQQRKNQIEMDRHTLETSDVIPPQIMDEMSAGLASALAGGKGAGLEQTKMQQLSSLQKDIAKARSYSGKPYNALTDEQREFLQNTFQRLGNAYDTVLDARKAQLRKGRNYSANPAANAAMDIKAAPTASAPSGGQKLPKVGDVEDGHRYIGGPPGDPKSWEEVK